MKRTLFLISLLIVLIILPTFVWAEEPDDPQFKAFYQEGINNVRQGRYQDAYVSFEKALKLAPSSELVRFMINETGDLIIRDMMGNPELRQTAIRLLELGKGAHQRLIADADAINRWIEQMRGPFDKKWEAINMLSIIGQHSTPFLVERLNDVDESVRTNAMQALQKIGLEAVLPLIEALKSPTLLVRQNAAILLGLIKDERAVPALKAIYDNEKETPEIKGYAAESLQKITGQKVASLKSAKEYYYQIAEKYYYAYPAVMPKFYNEDSVAWRWNGETGRVEYRKVPDFTVNEELAEDACYAGLALDDNYDPLWSLLVCVFLQRYNEAEDILEAARTKTKTGQIDEATFTALQTDLAKAKEGPLLASLGGRKYLYQALKRSLNDGNGMVAVSCINALKRCAEAKDLPLTADATKAQAKIGKPLVEALTHQDKRIRYAAAQALLQINPNQPFAEAEKVIPIINDATGESGIRVVLVIEPDSETRNQLREELIKLNCYPIETASADEGLNRAKRFPSKDLFIIDSKVANHAVFSVDILGTQHTETVFDTLKTDIRTNGTPVFLIGRLEDTDNAKKIFADKVEGYLHKPVERDPFKETVDKVFQSEESQRDSKARAERMSHEAVDALAQLALKDTIYPYKQSVESLTQVLENRPDNTRLRALYALGRFGDVNALPALAKAFVNKENSKEVRVKTAEAMGEIFKVNPDYVVPEEIYRNLRDGLLEETEIKNAAAVALGNTKLTPAQQRELFELKRPK
ncbi:MAG: HEAT repeat domain-containing protein [Planctomycetes bacterium]|nr:HEAT repeat domain-containing protein [Planctomycetota bacterium]